MKHKLAYRFEYCIMKKQKRRDAKVGLEQSHCDPREHSITDRFLKSKSLLNAKSYSQYIINEGPSTRMPQNKLTCVHSNEGGDYTKHITIYAPHKKSAQNYVSLTEFARSSL